MAIPQIPIVATPTLFDKVLNAFNTNLVGELSWLDYAFGQAQKCTRVDGDGKEIIYPAVYAGANESNEYADVLPDEFLGSATGVTGFSWIDISNITHEATNPQMSGRVEAQASVVFWFNLEKVLNDSSEYRNLDLVVAQCLAAIKASNKGFAGSIVVSGWTIDADEIYSGYSIREGKQQFLMQPYAGIRFDCDITFFDSSCSEVTSFAPLAITNLTYSNDAQSIAEADPFVSMAPTLSPSQRATYRVSVLDTLPSFLTLNENTGVITDNGGAKSAAAYSFSVLVIVSNKIADTYEVTVTVTGAGGSGSLWKAHEVLGTSVVVADWHSNEGVTSASQRVSAWSDRSNSNDALQVIGGSKPIHLNQNLAVQENGNDVISNAYRTNIFCTPFPVLTQEFNFFFVGRLTAGANYSLWRADTPATNYINHTANSKRFDVYFGTTRQFNLTTDNENKLYGGVTLLHFLINGSSSKLRICGGAEISVSGDVGAQGLTGYDVYLGGRDNVAAAQFGGSQCEHMFVQGALSIANRENIEGQLAWDWGIQTRLPSGHTYESEAPTV